MRVYKAINKTRVHAVESSRHGSLTATDILYFLLCLVMFATAPALAGEHVDIPSAEDSAAPSAILFIGNSYTYGNNLPQMFYDLAASAGKTLVVDSSTFGGYTLEQHSVNSDTLNKINSQPWDVIILQEQSQFPTIDYYRTTSMYPAARTLDTLIKTRGASTCFFMTWGRKYGGTQTIGAHSSPPFADFFEMQDSLRSAYIRIAVELHAMVAPVGRAWGMALTLDPSVDLWTSDNSHPTVKGTYLAACVFYARLFEDNPTGLSYTGGLSAVDAEFLQQIAHQTVTTIDDSEFKRPVSYHYLVK